jgi:hypothetical protein
MQLETTLPVLMMFPTYRTSTVIIHGDDRTTSKAVPQSTIQMAIFLSSMWVSSLNLQPAQEDFAYFGRVPSSWSLELG